MDVRISYNVRREEVWDVPDKHIPILVARLHKGLGTRPSSYGIVELLGDGYLSSSDEYDIPEELDLRVEIGDEIWHMSDGIYDGPCGEEDTGLHVEAFAIFNMAILDCPDHLKGPLSEAFDQLALGKHDLWPDDAWAGSRPIYDTQFDYEDDVPTITMYERPDINGDLGPCVFKWRLREVA